MKILWTAPTQPTVEELPWFRFGVARLTDFNGAACVISRTGYSGELGYEIFCHPKDAQSFFDAIWAAGEPLDWHLWVWRRWICCALRPD